MRLEKLITTNPIFSRKLLTCYLPDSLKTLFFDVNPKGPNHLGPAWAHPRGPSLGPDAAGAGAADAGAAGRILKSRSRPLPTHPGMKYFRKETLAVDFHILCATSTQC